MNISLGRDQGIVIKREKRKDFTSDQFIGGNRIETRSWEISLRNTKKLPVHIVVNDQVPISQNKDIVGGNNRIYREENSIVKRGSSNGK